ncbi:DoxX family protein [Mycolicibacterium cosmeticum]|uniref:DoxX family protein n=3 Tax=Mycobacteriaceae TaxID=1762 RepID=W9AS33_MYCCO|nr:hypothetical protein AWB94_12255 [Mycolicibacterium canariasense]TLH65887.1 DoxX family protein [Mycolicibacterium cosmeticum]GAS99863.1 uncharacterized protein RMCC_6828 [Mycolicibacterium canariasense]CDO08323.1 hypothetical protein BN977_03142 [Mycolicibacterium cosmeticum]
MHLTTTILMGLSALLLITTGTMKLLNNATARGNADHLGISSNLSRAIGLAEIAAAAGLILGIIVVPLGIITATAVLILLIGAIVYHARVQDNFTAMLPAVLTAAAALAIIVLNTLKL